MYVSVRTKQSAQHIKNYNSMGNGPVLASRTSGRTVLDLLVVAGARILELLVRGEVPRNNHAHGYAGGSHIFAWIFDVLWRRPNLL